MARALAQLPERDRVQVWIAGSCEPRYEAYLRALSHQLGVNAIVRFVGRIPNTNIMQWYRSIDVAVLPSIWPENHPVSVLEAMAAARPIIASAVGGLPEMIRHGETGWLVPRADVPSLAQAMERLINDAPLCERMGRQAAREAKTNFSLAAHMAAVERVHAKALETAPTPGVSLDLVICAGFNGYDPALERLLRLWRVYLEITGRELPDVCEDQYLTDDQFCEAKVLVVPEWHARFARSVERAIDCGVPVVGPGIDDDLLRRVRTEGKVSTYTSHEGFAEQLAAILHPSRITDELQLLPCSAN